MNTGLISNSTAGLRGVLVTAALFGVVFPALAAGLHVHHDHVGDKCDICLQLDHLVFATAGEGHVADAIPLAGPVPAGPLAAPGLVRLADDPARAPPVLS